MTRADLIVIGSGPGGYETAAKGASEGRDVVIIERDLLGGTCLNRGCIPTKALCRTAEVAATVAEAAEFGIGAGEPSVDIASAMERKDNVVAALRDGVATVLRDVRVVHGDARFVSASVVKAAGEEFTAPEIVIATGSAPASLRIPGAELAMTSDDVLNLRELPESMAIIGGGVIGMEFASIFSALGVKVTVLEYCKEILPPFDSEIAKRLRTALKRRGIDIVTSAAVTAIEAGMRVSYEAKGKAKEVEAAAVLMAVGRIPVLPEGLDALGVKISRGAPETDSRMRVLFDGPAPEGVTLYAVGDVNRRCMLAHAAVMQGEVALGLREDTEVIPSAVFTMPECAMVGLTEEQCAERGMEIKVGKAMFRANGKAMAMGETDGLVKVIADAATDRVVGCHICGPHAADLIQEATLAISAGLTTREMRLAVHSHPTLCETLLAAIPG